MSIEGLDSREQLSVVAAGNQDLVVGADSGLEDGERTRFEFMFLELGDFEFSVSDQYR